MVEDAAGVRMDARSIAMEWLRLIGVAVVLVGFALKLRVTIVVLAAGVATGLVAQQLDGGASFGILATLGSAFVNGRVITLVILALPAIGFLERHGLQEECGRFIRRIGAATVGRLLISYHLFRSLLVALGIRLSSGQVIFTRPLVMPMALPAARLDDPAAEKDEATSADVDRIKAAAASSDNYANFFGQNLFFGSAGVALVVKNLADNGHPVNALTVAKFAIPVAAISFLLATAQYLLLDRWLRRRRAGRGDAP
jgi:uncharacterized membrane protein